MRHLGIILSLALLAPCGVLAQDATMTVPADYRQWVFLTSSLDLNYSAPSAYHKLDNVFVDPASYQAFLKTGTWPDKTILVLEIRKLEAAGSLSKDGQIQTDVVNLEIHTKDEARFPGKWAFFIFPDRRAPGKLMPQSATCYSCHSDHGAVDTTFVQFYPTLMPIAQAKGTLSAGYLKDSAAK